MLSQIIDSLFQLLINRAADGLAHRGRGSAKTASLSDAAPEPLATLGMSIPSALEAMRQGGKAEPRPVGLTLEERKRHLYILGATGTGKTNILLQLLQQDIEAGRGVCLLDARGDLVDRVLLRLAGKYQPADLIERLLVLDLRSALSSHGDDPHLIGFNPLGEGGADAYSRALFVLDGLRQQWGAALGVQTEETLRNSLLALALADPPYTLLEIEKILTVPPFRREVLKNVTDNSVLRFFERFESLPETQQLQWTTPVLNKVSPWLARPSLRRLLGQRHKTLSFRDLFDARPDAIVLICVGKDELYQASDLISGLVTSAVSSAIMRSDRPATAKGHTTFLYLDEFENFGEASKQFEAIISEGRRFGLGLVLSHQATSQLEPRLRNLIRNVVGTQMFFAVGGLDADQLAGEIPSEEPKAIIRNLLVSQKIGEALCIRRGKPFTRLRTTYVPDPRVSDVAMNALRNTSLVRWGRPLSQVDAELAERETPPAAPSVATDSQSAPKKPCNGRKKAASSAPEAHFEVRDSEASHEPGV